MTLVQRMTRVASVAGVVLVVGALAAPALGADNAVSIAGKKFDPPKIVVAQGDTVTWTITQAIGEPHSVTSGKPGAQTKDFDSGTENLQNNGQHFQHTFDLVGTFAYFCVVHPNEMQGEVIVLAPGQSAPAESAAPEEAAVGAEGGTPVERKVIAAGILVITLVVLFGAAWFYRRMNPDTGAH